MSQYLRFVLGRSHTPDPLRIAIDRPVHEWAARQLLDEFSHAFPAAEIQVCDDTAAARADLYVLPYSGRLDSRDRTKWPKYRQLQRLGNASVMLYGLDYRQIVVLRSREVFRYVLAHSIYAWAAEWERIPRALWRRLFRVRRL